MQTEPAVSIFPPELIFDILVCLPPKDLIRFLCVSKAWYALISDQRFIKAHLQRSIQTNSGRSVLLRSFITGHRSDFVSLVLNDDETIGTVVKAEQPLKCPDQYTAIVGNYSVHGLVCVLNFDHGNIALWNPSIQKFKKIPSITFQPSDSETIEVEGAHYGFGYDSVNDDYKLVGRRQIAYGDGVTASSQVQIYSLKSNSWKTIQNMPCNCFASSDRIVFLNGALIWLMYSKSDFTRYIILTLDLASETYIRFPAPVDRDVNCVLLEVFDGCLCICVNYMGTRNDVWIMKEYGVAESWALIFSIEHEAVPSEIDYVLKPLVFSKNGEMVLLTNNDVFFWFDLVNKSIIPVEFLGRPCYFDMTTICVGSLCLLDGDPVTVGRHQQVPSTS